MSTDQPPTDAPDVADGTSVTPTRTTFVASLVAVALLAGTGGALLARGGGGETESTTSTGGGGTAADTQVASVAEGEDRGLDEVHQDGDEDLENVLVSTDWLEKRIDEGLEESDIVLLDVSEELGSSELTPYDEGHIPGAQYVDWSSELTQPNTREFLTQGEFTKLAQKLGINDDSTIVLYGDNNNWFAAYAAWVFKLHGAEDVRLLDGGLQKWEKADKRELVQETPQPTKGSWKAKPQNFDIRAFQPEVLDATEDKDVNLLDIRGPEEYAGEVGVDPEIFEGEGTSIWGHIPTAVNVPWGEIVNEDGTYKSAKEIRAIYEKAGLDLDKPIIAYCRIGERASHSWFALSQILGADVQVYDGSWTEWGNTVGVPVTNETGERGGVWGSRARS